MLFDGKWADAMLEIEVQHLTLCSLIVLYAPKINKEQVFQLNPIEQRKVDYGMETELPMVQASANTKELIKQSYMAYVNKYMEKTQRTGVFMQVSGNRAVLALRAFRDKMNQTQAV